MKIREESVVNLSGEECHEFPSPICTVLMTLGPIQWARGGGGLYPTASARPGLPFGVWSRTTN